MLCADSGITDGRSKKSSRHRTQIPCYSEHTTPRSPAIALATRRIDSHLPPPPPGGPTPYTGLRPPRRALSAALLLVMPATMWSQAATGAAARAAARQYRQSREAQILKDFATLLA